VSRLKKLTDTALYQFVAARSQLLVFVRLTLSRLRQHDEAETYADVERFDEMNALNQEVLRAFRKEIEADGARPVMLLLPTPAQVLAERDLTIEKDDFPLAAACREALLETCAKEHLDCIDVLPALAGAADDPWKLFLHGEDGKPDFHYNEAGQRVVAEVLAAELERIHRAR
jgi:hypothetical protein